MPRNETLVLPLFKVVTSGDLLQVFPPVLPHIPLFHDLEVEDPQILLNPLFSRIVCLPENPTLGRILLETTPYLDLQFILMPSYGLHQLLHVLNFLLSLSLAYFDVLFPKLDVFDEQLEVVFLVEYIIHYAFIHEVVGFRNFFISFVQTRNMLLLEQHLLFAVDLSRVIVAIMVMIVSLLKGHAILYC